MQESLAALANGLALAGGRARLELMRQEHAPGLLAALDTPALWRYMPTQPPTTLSMMSAFVDSALAQQAAGIEVPFVIFDTSTGKICGSTRYLDMQPAHRALEIGWTWLSTSVQRTSINTECKLLLLRFAFDVLHCVRVQIKCDGRNVQSQNAIARLGAVREGVLRNQRILWDGYIRDAVYFSIIDREWPMVREGLESKLAAR
ncbi:MAG TPA: GNAT family protein [Phycisphaerales bacterium]|nr:GNAT family protein [Phycisphaerales bacterium]